MGATDHNEPIAIIGLAGLFPGSSTVPEFFRNILRKRCFVREVPDWLWEQDVFYSEDKASPAKTYSRLGALLDDVDLDLTSFRIPPAVAARMSRNQKLALVCARQALADAGYPQREFDHDRTGVIMAATGGERGEITDENVQTRRLHARLERLAQTPEQKRQLERLWQAYEKAFPETAITEDTLPGEIGSLVAGRIASAFDLHGMNLTLDAACASSLAAVSLAVDALRARTCDMVIAGGVDTDMSAKAYVTFAKVSALSANGSYPFDSRGDGFVMGEGCGVLILKRYADAVRDGDGIYAVIKGWGSSSDGAGKGITAPRAEGQVLALRRAYADLDFSLANLHFLECHGTGTQVGDATELASVSQMVVEAGRTSPLPIGSVKAMVGHLRLASGIAGLFRAILAVHCRVVPPQVNFESPNPNLDWTAARLRVPQRPEPIADPEVRAAVSGFGFGGINFHVALTSPLVQGRDPVVKVEDFQFPELPPLINDTAFLFPGQGSQYAGMLAEIGNDPISREMLARVNAVATEITGRSLAVAIASDMDAGAEDREAEIRATAVAQPALFAFSAILLRKMREQGIPCGMAIGHSLGEYSALHAAGILRFEDALRAVCMRAHLMSTLPASQAGAMAVVAAGPETVRALLDKVGGYLVCANLNSYDQTVVSGEPTAVRALVELAMAGGLRSSLLNVDRAFHSNLVSPVVAPLRTVLEDMTLFTSDVVVPANLSRQVYPFVSAGQAGRAMSEAERARVIDLLSRQVDNPVDFVAQVELAYEAGIRRFVEIGPRNVLTRLVEDILQGKPFQAIAMDQAPQTALKNLATLAARLREPLSTRRRPLRIKPRTAQIPVAGPVVADESLSPAERVRHVVAQVTGYAPDKIGDEAEFERDLGIDTLKIVDIITRLRGQVLPPRFTNFRQATSVRKILSFATAVPGGAATAEMPTTKVERPLQCYRYETAIIGPLPDPDSEVAPGRFRIVHMPGSVPADAASGGVQSDDASPNTLVLAPLPATPEALCDQVIPAIFSLVQGLANCAGGADAGEVHLITFAPAEHFHAAAFRALAALMKSLQKDMPRLHFAYSHLDGSPPDEALLRRVLTAPSLGRRIHVDGRIEAGRLLRHSRSPLSSAALAAQLGPQDVVLVTGGARGIAAQIVRHLLSITSARFILVGRKPQEEEWIAAEARGRVEYLVADLCDSDAVRKLDLGRRGITLVIHAAGILVSRPLRDVRREEVAQVLGSKILGLHRVLAQLDAVRLRGIVNFASVAGYFGGDGHPDYAAANAYLDGMTWGKVPILSIGWSAWDGVGMATAQASRQFLELSGVELIPLRAGVEIFTELLGAFFGLDAPRSQNIVVSAGLASACCLSNDPLHSTFTTLTEPVMTPTSILEPDSVAIPPELLLGDTAVKVLPLAEAADYAEAQLETLFTFAERAEIQTVPSGKRRMEKLGGKLAAKLLARDVLRDWCDEDVVPASIQILAPEAPVQVRVPNDPRLDTRLRGICFSISHTDDLVCAAAGKQRVGIDVERIRPLSSEVQREICDEFLQAAMDAFRGNTEVPPLGVFTQKEAVLKAAGVGIGNGLSEVRIETFNVRAPVLARFRGSEYRVVTVVDEGHVFSLAAEIVAAAPAGIRKVVPASIGQEGLWFQEKMGAMGSAYSFPWQERYHGPLDADALARSVQFIVDRHEALRTVFREEGGRCLAEVLPRLDIGLAIVDLGQHPEDRALSEVEIQGSRIIGQAFDLASGPLLRTVLFRLAAEDHILLLVFHHAIMDGFSSGIFRKELTSAYRAFHAGEFPQLMPLPMQYGDYAKLQRERLTAGRVDELVDYWRAQVAGAPERLDLPTDRRRAQVQTSHASYIVFPLSSATMQALRELGKSEGVSMFVTLLAAFQTLLMRLSGQTDIVVGAPFVGREASETFALVGYFANMLPLRTDLSDNSSFRQLLPRVWTAVMGALEHQELPFPKLVEMLMPRRNAAYAPFFQAAFGLLQDDGEGLALDGLQREVSDLPAGGAEFDLTLTVRAGCQTALLEYNADLFAESSMRSLADRFQRLLDGIAANPEERVSALPLLADLERQRLLVEWNSTDRNYPAEACVHRLFEAQAARTPEAMAVMCGDTGLTYRQLNACSNRLAGHLQALGVGPDVPVALCAERSCELVVGMMAILKAGGAYVPMDPDYPPERLAFMLDDLQTPLLLTQRPLANRLPLAEGKAICLLEDWADPASAPTAEPPNPAGNAGGENLAYVIYTSGSTGRPKGVQIPHKALTNHMRWMQSAFPLNEQDAVLQKTLVGFDASVWEFFAPLLAGGRLVLARPGGHQDLEYLVDTIDQHRITILQMVPSLLELLLERPRFKNCRSLRRVFCGGEALSSELVRKFCDVLDAELHNLYGPTEVTIDSVFYSIDRQRVPDIVPIGKPVDNVRAYILDAQLQPVPIGVSGELVLGGVQVARGYHHRPELTAERFVPDPFCRSAGARLFKTGDRARHLPDGNIEFLGRMDQMVKLRGCRIELGEIESVLQQQDGVRQCAVIVHQAESGESNLVAYVVSDSSRRPTSQPWRDALRTKLPDYMIPSFFVKLDALPLTPNGKIDRKALPVPDAGSLRMSRNYAPPRDPVEEGLAAVWCEILGLKRVGIHDNFFDRGGHSLLGVRLVMRIREAFQVSLPMRSLFQAPTIAEQAASVKAGMNDGAAGTCVLEVQKGRSGPPLFFVPGGAGGEAEYLTYARMTRHLGIDCPVYGFRARGLDGRTRPHTHTKAMAADYLSEMRSVQATGPYFLAGECVGGILAYEMAQQLRAQGETVAFLAMLDTFCPSPNDFLRSLAESLRPRLNKHWGRLFRHPKRTWWLRIPKEVISMLLEFGDDLGCVVWHLPADANPEQRQRFAKRLFHIYIRTLSRYRPKPYAGPLTLLLSSDFGLSSESVAAWKALAPERVEMHEVDGNHNTYIRDHATTTGRVLGTGLAHARREHGADAGSAQMRT